MQSCNKLKEVFQKYEEEASTHVAEKNSGSKESGNGKGMFEWKPETLEVLAETFLILVEIVAQGKGGLEAYFVEALLGETIDLLCTDQISIDFCSVHGRRGRVNVGPQVKSLASFHKQT